ncbi:MAG TPA: hypothetical protein PKV97_03905 [Thauera aminoaromatica]|nr:hypothetical protein [Thauera aminoaromatica]HND57421.1 hypothetical protein [Thauera aminoaromatica]HON29415.1 hypothetical protein [Ottowia sp.]
MTGRVDWECVLADLAWVLGEPMPGSAERTPLGTRALAERLRVSRGALRNWCAGTEPRHSDALRLLQRWSELTGKPASMAPVRRA